MTVIDPYGRRINYLRLSVTDRCNLRCTYCMPAAGLPKLTHGEILSYEDLLRITKAAVDMGVEKIRVTGGEPLVREGIIGFLEKLSALRGLKRLVLTTNGVLLEEKAVALRDVGVESLNISLDSLRSDRFAQITRGGDLHQVLRGIEAVEKAGFPFVKINVVVMRGVNDDEVADFAAMTIDRPCRVRFIEYMPTIRQANQHSLMVPGEELLAKIATRYPLKKAPREDLAGPASYHQIAGAAGQIGVITPVSCHFCHECNRIRITSTGIAKSCLFADSTIDLKPLLRQRDDEALMGALCRVIQSKPERHAIGNDAAQPAPFDMSEVGG